MADPTLDAYLQALGFNQQKDLANQQAGQQQGQVQASYDIALPELWRNTAQQGQNVVNDALGRGVYSSGETQRNMADVNTEAQQKLAQLNLSRDQGSQDIAMNLARQQAGYDIGQRTATYNWNQWNDAQQQALAQQAQQQASTDALNNWLAGQLGQAQQGPGPATLPSNYWTQTAPGRGPSAGPQ